MKPGRFVVSAVAVVAAVAVALIAISALRDGSQLATPSTSPATTPSASPSVTSSPQPTAPQAGAITGALSYPADFVPPLTVYAVSVADQRVFFSVDTPRYGGVSPSPPSASVPPGGATYTISGVTPGTYHVFAYRNDNLPNDAGGPALYSKFVVTCMQPSRAGLPYPSGACDNGPTTDHSLVPVTVRAGETMSRIDPWDWTSQQQVQQGNLPPRPR
jgi:hypothetical protein